MKSLKLYTLLFTSFFMLTLVSCNKTEEEENVSPNVALLTAGKWRGSAVYANGQDQTAAFETSNQFNWSNYSAVFERDGRYVEYYEDNTLTENVWQYENNERAIVFNKGSDEEYSIVISKLDEDEFWYIQSGVELRLVR